MSLMSDALYGKRGLNPPQAAQMNALQYRFYYELLEQMACSLYRWENLPSELDERFMELALFNRGLCLFFEDDSFDRYFATWATPSGTINMYQNPTRFMAYGADGFNRLLDAEDCVPIWNNYLRRPDINAMRIFARRLADIDRTLDVNLAAQKMPVLVTCPESLRLTVKNLLKQWNGNEPVVVGDPEVISRLEIAYLSPNVPYIGDKLLDAHREVWSQVMTYFGISNNNVDKAERVQAAEVDANNGQIVANRLTRLKIRRMACKQINRKYGLEVWVDFDNDVSSLNEDYLLLVDPEGENAEEVLEV